MHILVSGCVVQVMLPFPAMPWSAGNPESPPECTTQSSRPMLGSGPLCCVSVTVQLLPAASATGMEMKRTSAPAGTVIGSATCTGCAVCIAVQDVVDAVGVTVVGGAKLKDVMVSGCRSGPSVKPAGYSSTSKKSEAIWKEPPIELSVVVCVFV